MDQHIAPGGDNQESHLDSSLQALKASPEFLCPIEPTADPHIPEHLALLYETKAEQVETVVAFIRQGLERGEQCIIIHDEVSERELRVGLTRAGIDTGTAVASGALSFHTVEDTHLKRGEFDADEMLDFLAATIETATAEYSGLRITGETTWVQKETTSMTAFIAYEARVNELLAGTEGIALCQYDRTAFSPEVIRDVIRTHPHLVYKGSICQNDYYIPPEEFFKSDQLGSEVDRMLDTLVASTEVKTRIVERERFQRELNAIIADPSRSFEEKLQAMFGLGSNRFGLELGGLARVDVETDSFELEYVSGEHSHLKPGLEVPLSETYCRAAVESKDPVSVFDPHEAGYDDRMAYEEFGIRAYIGSYVEVDTVADRTFFFVSEENREEPFSTDERTFLRTMAQWVHYELERGQHECKLKRYETLFEESRDANAVIDAHGIIQHVTPSVEHVLGYAPDELVGENCFDYCHPDDQSEVRAEYQTMIDDPTYESTSEFRFRHADGSWIVFESHGRNLLDDPEIEGIVAYNRDVTDRRKRERNRRKLYETTADPSLSFEAKVERLLELGCTHFGFETGFFSHITNDELEILEAVGPHKLIQPEATAPLSETYCRHQFPSDGPMGVADATREGLKDDPAYDRYGLQSYLGTNVTAGGEPYGTLCFTSRTPRDRPFREVDYTFLELLGQWVSYELERERRETQFAALSEMSRDLMDAERSTDVAERTIEHARTTLALPMTALIRYDEQTGTLIPTAQTPRASDELPVVALCDPNSGPLWEGFVAGESRQLDDVAALSGASDDLTEVVSIPLGKQGLFVTATKAPSGFSGTERGIIETTAATVKSAYTRTDRERQLQLREQTLEEQNETLARLNRVNDIIRNIDQALVRASTRTEVEAVVCEQLADIGPYEFAWIGEYDPVSNEVVSREAAGMGKGYLDEITITTEEHHPTGRGPVGRAIRSREPQVDDVLMDESFKPWRQQALNRGYHACMALPLAYGNSMYGVLAVYAGQPDVFDDLEQSVLAELSDTIAYAINAVESKKALVSDVVTELEFTVEDDQLEALMLARETGSEVTLESVVPGPDGQFRIFFTTRGTEASEVLDFEPKLAVTEIELISENEDDETCLFEVKPNEDNIVGTLLEHGGAPSAITVTEESATIIVELPSDGAVREFVQMMRVKYPASKLVAQRTRERTTPTPAEFHASVTVALTPRQLEALQTAYFSGYFEKPRDRTGSEIAASMGISQPTFNHHVQAAHRKIYRRLFEADLEFH